MNASRSLCSLVCLFLFSTVVHADPRIQYSSYLSGSKTTCVDTFNNPCNSGIDPGAPYARAVGIAVDGSKNIYVAGITNETDFPNTMGQKVPLFCTVDASGNACRPATSFLAKFSSSGQLVYSTFLPNLHQAYGLAVDSSGSAYVIGDTNLSESSFRNFLAVIDKFTSSGTLAYQFTLENNCSACDNGDTALAIALNATGTAAFVAGTSTQFPCVHSNHCRCIREQPKFLERIVGSEAERVSGHVGYRDLWHLRWPARG